MADAAFGGTLACMARELVIWFMAILTYWVIETGGRSGSPLLGIRWSGICWRDFQIRCVNRAHRTPERCPNFDGRWADANMGSAFVAVRRGPPRNLHLHLRTLAPIVYPAPA